MLVPTATDLDPTGTDVEGLLAALLACERRVERLAEHGRVEGGELDPRRERDPLVHELVEALEVAEPRLAARRRGPPQGRRGSGPGRGALAVAVPRAEAALGPLAVAVATPAAPAAPAPLEAARRSALLLLDPGDRVLQALVEVEHLHDGARAVALGGVAREAAETEALERHVAREGGRLEDRVDDLLVRVLDPVVGALLGRVLPGHAEIGVDRLRGRLPGREGAELDLGRDRSRLRSRNRNRNRSRNRNRNRSRKRDRGILRDPLADLGQEDLEEAGLLHELHARRGVAALQDLEDLLEEPPLRGVGDEVLPLVDRVERA